MVSTRLLFWLEHHEKLPGSQFGLCKGKSYTDNLSILYWNFINASIKDKGTTAAFLDVKAAYDNILPDILDNKLKNFRSSPEPTSLGLEPGLPKSASLQIHVVCITRRDSPREMF
jgi:hypothetical protein